VQYKIEMIADVAAVVGEGPVWDPGAKCLYWTDIRTGRMFRYIPSKGEHRQVHSGVFVGGLAVNRRGGLTLGTWEGVMLWRSDQDWRWLHHAPPEGGQRESRSKYQFNDCKAGPDGSFYAGSYYEGQAIGKLYRFRPDGRTEVVAEGLGVSNGMGFTTDLRTFYHTDSAIRTIYKYDYSPKTHKVSNRQVFVKLPDTEGVPDGMTVDAEDHVWTATWGGGCVIRFDPDGKEERRIRFPATQISSAMFGGADYMDLYVTSASAGTGQPPSGFEPRGYDFSAHRGGALYRVRLEVKGKPEFETDFPWPG
jgi:D-xylonolactonase